MLCILVYTVANASSHIACNKCFALAHVERAITSFLEMYKCRLHLFSPFYFKFGTDYIHKQKVKCNVK